MSNRLESISQICTRFPFLAAEENFSFAEHTTIGCGGVAALALSPADTRETAEVIDFLKTNAVPYCLLGAGANVLPAGGFFPGVVVRFTRMKTLRRQGGVLYAGAGVTGGELLRFARANGIGGFEPLVGIPTTAGGGVAMNAGTADRHFADLVVRVVCVRGGEVLHLSRAECEFGEKDSIFLRRSLAVTGVFFQAETAQKEEIARRTEYYRGRRAHLPNGRSMGCTFVNPKGISAGALIEGCGLKGLREGGAFVSEEHANFIINCGGTSEEVAKLIQTVKEQVYIRTGILLREEIRRIP